MKVLGKCKAKQMLRQLQKQYPDVRVAIMTSSKTCVCLSVIRKKNKPLKYDLRTFFEVRNREFYPTQKGVRLTQEQFKGMRREIVKIEKL